MRGDKHTTNRKTDGVQLQNADSSAGKGDCRKDESLQQQPGAGLVWSRLSEQRGSPSGAWHQRPQTQVNISTKLVWLITRRPELTKPCYRYTGGRQRDLSRVAGLASLCGVWEACLELRLKVWVQEPVHAHGVSNKYTRGYLQEKMLTHLQQAPCTWLQGPVHPPRDLAKSMPQKGPAGLSFTTSTSLGLSVRVHNCQ